MDLILWRHAEAREPKADEDDLQRPLTARGERQAERMAHWLNRFLPDSTRLLVSPALRARQTAEALGKKARVVAPLAPGSTAIQVLTAARWPDSREPVLLVGHQPSLGQAIALLMGGEAAAQGQAWAMRKGAVWWLRHRVRQGVPEVVLVSVHSPDRL